MVSILGTPPTTWDNGYKLARKKGISFGQYQKKPLETIIRDASPEAIDLIEQMLSYDPQKRPTASQILTHPYFTKSMKMPPTVGPSPLPYGEVSAKEVVSKRKTLIQDNQAVSNRFSNPSKNVVNLQSNKGAGIADLDCWDDDDIFDTINYAPLDITKKASNAHNNLMANHSGVGKGAHEASAGFMTKSGTYQQGLFSAGKTEGQGGYPAAKPAWDSGKDQESMDDEFDFDKPAAMKNKQAQNAAAPKKNHAFDDGWADEY